MGLRHDVLVLNWEAGAVVKPYRVVMFDANGKVVHTNNDDAKSIGVSMRGGAAAAGDSIDIVHAGIAEVEYNGNIALGDAVVGISDGKAFASSTNAKRAIGIAMKSGAQGDIGSILISPGII